MIVKIRTAFDSAGEFRSVSNTIRSFQLGHDGLIGCHHKRLWRLYKCKLRNNKRIQLVRRKNMQLIVKET